MIHFHFQDSNVVKIVFQNWGKFFYNLLRTELILYCVLRTEFILYSAWRTDFILYSLRRTQSFTTVGPVIPPPPPDPDPLPHRPKARLIRSQETGLKEWSSLRSSHTYIITINYICTCAIQEAYCCLFMYIVSHNKCCNKPVFFTL
jgi:hypothetical protein